MRLILIGLLILNIAVFAWFARFPESPGSDTAGADLTAGGAPEATSEAVRLQLLSERGRNSSSVAGTVASQPILPATARDMPDDVSVPPAASIPGADTVPDPAGAACYEIGPFADQADLDRFIAAYQAAFTLEPFTRQRQLRIDHRVYLPPFASRAQAQQALDTLRERLTAERLSIDTLLITRGENENGIALGVFSESRNASNVQTQLQRLGYDVRIVEEPRLQEELWIAVSEFGAGAESGARLTAEWPAITRQRPLLQRSEKLC
jgi:hypothetical protein